MGYQLGVDLGTTYTAAAVHRDGRVEIVTLGNRAASIPSAIFLREDEQILTGDAASRRGVTEPDRVAREFKRRVGDPTPLLLGGTPYSAETLMAKLLRWTVDTVAGLEGGAPDHVTVSHPANWGPYKKDLLAQALRMAELDAVTSTISEPEAAAIYYASNARVEPGSVIAVYDLGGGTFDAAVLRKTADGWEILGTPEGIERLGGIDFDEAVFAHVRRSLEGRLEQLDPSEPAALAGVARLRQDAVEAKEALSSDSDVSIPVVLPNVSTEVRLTRSELEAMIRPTLQETISALRRALTSAGIEPADVSAVLLVGGSSRIPLVTQLVGAELGRPVAVDAHPKHSIALGAAIEAGQRGQSAAAPVAPGTVEVDAGVEAMEPAVGTPIDAAPTGPAPTDSPPTVPIPAPTPAGEVPGAPPPPPPAAAPDAVPAEAPTPATTPGDGDRKMPIGLIAGIAGAVVVAILAFVLLSGGGGDNDGKAQQASDTETTQSDDTTETTADEGDDDTTGTTRASGVGGPSVPDVRAEILSIDVEPGSAGGQYVMSVGVTNFVPVINDPEAFHIHLFWDTTEPENAGMNGPNQKGEWLLWGTDSGDLREVTDVFFATNAKPEAADAICVIVADHDHNVADVDGDREVDLNTGNCLDIPA